MVAARSSSSRPADDAAASRSRPSATTSSKLISRSSRYWNSARVSNTMILRTWRQPALGLQRLVDELLVLGEEVRGAAVLELILDLGDRAGRVDAVADGAAAHPRHVGDEELAARIGHGGDTLAALQAERLQPGQKLLDRIAIGPPGDFLIEALVLVAERNAARRRRAPRQEPLRNAPGAQLRSSPPIVASPAHFHPVGHSESFSGRSPTRSSLV